MFISGGNSMLLALLALTAQNAVVTTEPAKAAMACATSAVVVSPATDSELRKVSQFMYFAMQAAKAEPGDKPYILRLGEIAGSVDKSQIPAAEAAAATIAGCDRSFPLARSTAPARLPVDPFARDMMCMGVLSLLQGATEQAEVDTLNKAVNASLAKVMERLSEDVLTKRGLTTEEAVLGAMGDQVKASLPIGNPETVARACGVSGL